MPLRPVLQFPDPRLKRKSVPVGAITDEVRALAEDMIEVMYDEPGIGLAAPQVGEAIRLVVMDTGWNEEGGEKNPRVMVNPEIVLRETGRRVLAAAERLPRDVRASIDTNPLDML